MTVKEITAQEPVLQVAEGLVYAVVRDGAVLGRFVVHHSSFPLKDLMIYLTDAEFSQQSGDEIYMRVVTAA